MKKILMSLMCLSILSGSAIASQSIAITKETKVSTSNSIYWKSSGVNDWSEIVSYVGLNRELVINVENALNSSPDQQFPVEVLGCAGQSSIIMYRGMSVICIIPSLGRVKIHSLTDGYVSGTYQIR